MAEKKKCYQITMPELTGSNGYIETEHAIISAIEAEIESLEVGDSMMIKVVELTQKELDDAPEFEGW